MLLMTGKNARGIDPDTQYTDVPGLATMQQTLIVFTVPGSRYCLLYTSDAADE